MAEIVLGVLCLLVGLGAALLAVLSAWAGALEVAATGSGGTGYWPLFLAGLSVAGIVGGVSLIM